jgi:hypothetical protein
MPSKSLNNVTSQPVVPFQWISYRHFRLRMSPFAVLPREGTRHVTHTPIFTRADHPRNTHLRMQSGAAALAVGFFTLQKALYYAHAHLIVRLWVWEGFPKF